MMRGGQTPESKLFSLLEKRREGEQVLESTGTKPRAYSFTNQAQKPCAETINKWYTVGQQFNYAKENWQKLFDEPEDTADAVGSTYTPYMPFKRQGARWVLTPSTSSSYVPGGARKRVSPRASSQARKGSPRGSQGSRGKGASSPLGSAQRTPSGRISPVSTSSGRVEKHAMSPMPSGSLNRRLSSLGRPTPATAQPHPQHGSPTASTRASGSGMAADTQLVRDRLYALQQPDLRGPLSKCSSQGSSGTVSKPGMPVTTHRPDTVARPTPRVSMPFSNAAIETSPQKAGPLDTSTVDEVSPSADAHAAPMPDAIPSQMLASPTRTHITTRLASSNAALQAAAASDVTTVVQQDDPDLAPGLQAMPTADDTCCIQMGGTTGGNAGTAQPNAAHGRPDADGASSRRSTQLEDLSRLLRLPPSPAACEAAMSPTTSSLASNCEGCRTAVTLAQPADAPGCRPAQAQGVDTTCTHPGADGDVCGCAQQHAAATGSSSSHMYCSSASPAPAPVHQGQEEPLGSSGIGSSNPISGPELFLPTSQQHNGDGARATWSDDEADAVNMCTRDALDGTAGADGAHLWRVSPHSHDAEHLESPATVMGHTASGAQGAQVVLADDPAAFEAPPSAVEMDQAASCASTAPPAAATAWVLETAPSAAAEADCRAADSSNDTIQPGMEPDVVLCCSVHSSTLHGGAKPCGLHLSVSPKGMPAADQPKDHEVPNSAQGPALGAVSCLHAAAATPVQLQAAEVGGTCGKVCALDEVGGEAAMQHDVSSTSCSASSQPATPGTRPLLVCNNLLSHMTAALDAPTTQQPARGAQPSPPEEVVAAGAVAQCALSQALPQTPSAAVSAPSSPAVPLDPEPAAVSHEPGPQVPSAVCTADAVAASSAATEDPTACSPGSYQPDEPELQPRCNDDTDHTAAPSATCPTRSPAHASTATATSPSVSPRAPAHRPFSRASPPRSPGSLLLELFRPPSLRVPRPTQPTPPASEASTARSAGSASFMTAASFVSAASSMPSTDGFGLASGAPSYQHSPLQAQSSSGSVGGACVSASASGARAALEPAAGGVSPTLPLGRGRRAWRGAVAEVEEEGEDGEAAWWYNRTPRAAARQLLQESKKIGEGPAGVANANAAAPAAGGPADPAQARRHREGEDGQEDGEYADFADVRDSFSEAIFHSLDWSSLSPDHATGAGPASRRPLRRSAAGGGPRSSVRALWRSTARDEAEGEEFHTPDSTPPDSPGAQGMKHTLRASSSTLLRGANRADSFYSLAGSVSMGSTGAPAFTAAAQLSGGLASVGGAGGSAGAGVGVGEHMGDGSAAAGMVAGEEAEVMSGTRVLGSRAVAGKGTGQGRDRSVRTQSSAQGGRRVTAVDMAHTQAVMEAMGPVGPAEIMNDQWGRKCAIQ